MVATNPAHNGKGGGAPRCISGQTGNCFNESVRLCRNRVMALKYELKDNTLNSCSPVRARKQTPCARAAPVRGQIRPIGFYLAPEIGYQMKIVHLPHKYKSGCRWQIRQPLLTVLRRLCRHFSMNQNWH